MDRGGDSSLRSAWRTQIPDIPDGWLAKQATVFTIELTRAFVSNLEGDSGCVNIIGEHQGPRGLQSNLLLILKRTHCRECPEMMVKRRDRHARNFCKFFNAKRSPVVCLDPGDCFRRAVTLVSQCRDCS